jgi:hypothetical protein
MTLRLASTSALRAMADKPLAQGRARLSFAPARYAVMTATLLLCGGSSTLLACPVCFGADETPLIDGAKLGMFALLGVTLAVQGGFVGFFLYLRRRAKFSADVPGETESR